MKNKKNSRFQRSTIALLAVAVVLLAGSAIGSTRAALTYYSEVYDAQMNTPEIGVTLVENGADVAADGEEGSLLTEIGAGAFEFCYSLKSIALPEGLTKIGANVFDSAVSLKEVSLPSTLKSVGNYAFSGASSLETVNSPAIESSSGFTANYMFD